MNYLGGISAVLAAILGFFTWTISLTVLNSGVPYLGKPDSWTTLFFLAPLPLGIRLLCSSFRLSGVWLIVLTPIISTFSLVVVIMSFQGTGYGQFALAGLALLWLYLPFSDVEGKRYGTSGSTSASLASRRPERRPEASCAAIDKGEGSENTQTELIPVLDAADIRKIAATASKEQAISVLADSNAICRLFNAIRYGQVETVKQALSRDPVLILAKDVYGNSPIDVARQEGNTELLTFIEACSPQA